MTPERRTGHSTAVRLVAGALLGLAIVLTGSSPTETHTPIASRWNYNEHLFPIFRDNCGACHREGGIAPMSLVAYNEAFPWAQSIREEVLGLRMPPWKAEDGFGDFRNGHALSAKEMDMILEWSSGGYPQGPRSMQLEPVTAPADWPLGTPDLELEMPVPFTVDAGTSETVRYFVLPSGSDADRLVNGADIMPGAGAVVRDVAIYVDSSGAARTLDEADAEPGFGEPDGADFPTTGPVALWSPGRASVVLEGTAHPMPTGADVVVRIHYKKTWITEGQEFTDRSRVGLYFAEGDAAAIESMLIASPADDTGQTISFSQAIDGDVQVLAMLPEIEIAAKDVQIVAVTPDGSRVPMLFLREPDTAWPTRYWFDSPLSLPDGTTIEVEAVIHPGADHRPGRSLFGADTAAPIRLMMDYAAGAAVAN